MGNTSSQGAFSIAMLVYRSAVKKIVKHFPAMDIKKKVEKTTTTHILTHFGMVHRFIIQMILLWISSIPSL